jgi:hypothetical protein
LRSRPFLKIILNKLSIYNTEQSIGALGDGLPGPSQLPTVVIPDLLEGFLETKALPVSNKNDMCYLTTDSQIRCTGFSTGFGSIESPELPGVPIQLDIYE